MPHVKNFKNKQDDVNIVLQNEILKQDCAWVISFLGEKKFEM